MIIKLIDFEEMLKLYVKFIKKEITNDELELLKYNIEASCCLNEVVIMKLKIGAKNILGDKEWNETYNSNLDRDLI